MDRGELYVEDSPVPMLSDAELLRKVRKGEALPLPRALLERPNGNSLLLGYVLGLEKPGQEFALGIREYIKTTKNSAELRTVLEKIRDEGVALALSERDWTEVERMAKSKNFVIGLSASMYGALAGSITERLDVAILVGICAGLLASRAMEYYDKKLALKLAGERADVLLSLLKGQEHLNTRNE